MLHNTTISKCQDVQHKICAIRVQVNSELEVSLKSISPSQVIAVYCTFSCAKVKRCYTWNVNPLSQKRVTYYTYNSGFLSCDFLTHNLCGVGLVEGHAVRLGEVDVGGGLPEGCGGVGTSTWRGTGTGGQGRRGGAVRTKHLQGS